MQKRLLVFNILGMALDVLKPEVNSKFAYSIRNMRLVASKDSNLLSLTTERGTQKLTTREFGNPPIDLVLVGTFLGSCILNDNLVLFTKDLIEGNLNPDHIYKLYFHNYGSGMELDDMASNHISFELLYKGNLNFSLTHPIEAIVSYEGEESQKVYWVDGLNQPRAMNIVNSYIDNNFDYDTNSFTYDPFSFTLEVNISGTNSISVTKQFFGGLFNAGVVLYAFCYYKKNLLESNIVSFTPLYYISFSDRGEEPGKQVSCSFNITVTSNEVDVSHFDYIRVFQIYSTSLNELPVVKIIKDIDVSILTLDNQYSYSFVDSNEFLVDTSTYEIQMIKQFIVPLTIVSKDDTLFLGNYKSNFIVNKTDLSELTTKPNFSIYNRSLQIDDGSDAVNVYKYLNLLDKSSRDIKTFKYGEHYKFGVQFLNKYGLWSEPYYLADVTNNVSPSGYNSTNGTCLIPYAQLHMSLIYSKIMSDGSDLEKEYLRARPVVSFPTLSERLILCQGVLNPTVFNLTDRVNGTTYALASWFFRPYPSISWSGNSTYKRKEADTDIYRIEGATCLYKHLYPLFPSDDIGGELLNMYFDSTNVGDNATVGDLVASALDKMLFIYPSFLDIRDYAKTLVISTWGVGENLKDDWAVSSLPNFISGDYPLTGDRFRVEVVVLENRYNPSDYTVGYLKVRVTFEIWPDWLVDGATHIRTVAGNINGASDSLRPETTSCNLGTLTSPTRRFENYYYVDLSMVTLNSPDIEFDSDVQNCDMSQYSVRIIGYIPLLSNSGSYKINATTPLFKMNWDTNGLGWARGVNLPTGFYKKPWQVHSRWEYCSGHGILISQGCWFDDINGIFLFDNNNHTGWNPNSLEYLYFVHPWLRLYLNNYNHSVINATGAIDEEISIEDIESSKINRKILSNIKFSENTIYFNTPYELNLESQLKLFNSDYPVSLVVENDKLYQGTVDLLITTTSEFMGVGFTGSENDAHTDLPKFTAATLLGYPLIVTGQKFNPAHTGLSLNSLVDWIGPRAMCGTLSEYNYTPNESSVDPILMRYRSTPHAVFKLQSSELTEYGFTHLAQEILPIGLFEDNLVDHWDYIHEWEDDSLSESGKIPLIWTSDNYNAIKQDILPINTPRGYLWLGEIYRKLEAGEQTSFDINNDDFSLQQRSWVVAGNEVDFNPSSILKWYEGDTFYQRYDCLKTAPFSDEDYLSVVEILSFMCETRVNLDGRYDRNRGLLDNTNVDITNFNLLNSVYNQENNFYTYNILDKDLFNVNVFNNLITWTLPKTNGAKIDNWTKITLSSTTDADGSRGEITALRKFKDGLFCFQTSGIGKILYNERVLIPVSDGIPIEIGNSHKMQGIKYINNIIGCQNKWACKETSQGIYFVDNNTPGIYRVVEDDKLVNLTKFKYMLKWFELVNVGLSGSWNILAPTNGVINYDATTDEILFTTLNDSIVYSLLMDCFTGFFNYNTPAMYTLEKYPITIDKDCNIYRLRAGGYSYFYNLYQDFGLQIVAYPFDEGSFLRDCIYDNLWYKGDGFNTVLQYLPDEHFDNISVSNEYQFGSNPLEYTNSTGHINTTLRKKFRLWYARIPRNRNYQNAHGDRMRNPWLYISLFKQKPSGAAIRLNELAVDCFY